MQTVLLRPELRGILRVLVAALLVVASGCAVVPLRQAKDASIATTKLVAPGYSLPITSPAPRSVASLKPLVVRPDPIWERLSPELATLRPEASEPLPADEGRGPVRTASSKLSASEGDEPDEFEPIVTLSPVANPFCVVVPDRREVKDLITEFTSVQRSTFVEALRRSGRYLPMMRSALAEESLPPELAYLSLVESHYQPDARSVSGAMGLWQFMEPTARDYGLRVDRWADERLDPETATRAAVRYLGDLFARFGDWNLAAAAYNAGAGGVGRAKDRYSAESFWDLYGIRGLRDETCRYVVKFLAAIAIAGDPKAYGLDVGQPDPPLAYDTVWTDSPILLRTVARLAAAPEGELRRLNPALLRGVTPPGVAYPVRVPAGSGETVATALKGLPEKERVALVSRRLRKGESVASIAKRYGMTRQALLAFNGIGGKQRVRGGEELWIPLQPGIASGPEPDTALASAPKAKGKVAASSSKATSVVHVVKRGETLWGIAKRYGVEPGDLLKKNGKSAGSSLKAGDRLLVVADRTDRNG